MKCLQLYTLYLNAYFNLQFSICTHYSLLLLLVKDSTAAKSDGAVLNKHLVLYI